MCTELQSDAIFQAKTYWIILKIFFLQVFLVWTYSGLFFIDFRPFRIPISITISIQIEKSIDSVLGIRTWSRSMVGADQTTELCPPPHFSWSFAINETFKLYISEKAIEYLNKLKFLFYKANVLAVAYLVKIVVFGKAVVVVVKWSACSLSTLTIQVWIPLESVVFILQVKSFENNKK